MLSKNLEHIYLEHDFLLDNSTKDIKFDLSENLESILDKIEKFYIKCNVNKESRLINRSVFLWFFDKFIKFFKGDDYGNKEINLVSGFFRINGIYLVLALIDKYLSLQGKSILDFIDYIPIIKILIGTKTNLETKRWLDYILQQGKNDLKQITSSYETFQDINHIINVITFLKLLKEKNKFKLKIVILKEEDQYFHSKLYIFPPINGSLMEGLIGSSNLSYSGFVNNYEVNANLTGKNDVAKLKEWFDKVWDEAFDYTSNLLEIIDEEHKNLIRKQKHFITPISLYKLNLLTLGYIRFGDTLFGNRSIEENDFLLPHQKDAINAAISVYKDRNNKGLILADSVGLGKTFIASGLIKYYLGKEKNKNIVIFVPASIRDSDSWQLTLKTYFNISESKIVTIKTYKDLEDNILRLRLGGYIFLLSHQMVKRFYEKIQEKNLFENISFILVDEVHNFRNVDSQKFKYLKELIHQIHHLNSELKILLLTATPFNNRASDFKALFRLFIFDNSELAQYLPKSVGVKQLKDIEDLLNCYDRHLYGKSLGDCKGTKDFYRKQINQILNTFMILRTKRFILKKYKHLTINGKNFKFFDPKPIPVQVEYRTVRDIYFDLAEKIENLHLPLVKLAFLISRNDLVAQDKFKTFNRILYLKRLASSIYAFKKSIERYLDKLYIFKNALETKNIEVIKEIYSDDNENEEIELNVMGEIDKEVLLKVEELFKIESFEQEIQKLMEDIKHDIDIVVNIKSILEKNRIKLFDYDEKLAELRSILLDIKGKKKILIFTEYKDTLEYIKNFIESDKDIVKYYSFEVIFGGRENKEYIIKRFAPKANKAENEISNEIDLLVSTDTLSEGVNLQDADVLINFDLPWNPVKIIQRIGRINRIGRETEPIIYNFYPPFIFQLLIKRLKQKIQGIQDLLGKEAPILSMDEDISIKNFEELVSSNAGELEEKYLVFGGEFVDSVLRDKFENIINNEFNRDIEFIKANVEKNLLLFEKGRIFNFNLDNIDKESYLSALKEEHKVTIYVNTLPLEKQLYLLDLDRIKDFEIKNIDIYNKEIENLKDNILKTKFSSINKFLGQIFKLFKRKGYYSQEEFLKIYQLPNYIQEELNKQINEIGKKFFGQENWKSLKNKIISGGTALFEIDTQNEVNTFLEAVKKVLDFYLSKNYTPELKYLFRLCK